MKQTLVMRIMMLLVLTIAAIGIGTVQQHADASWGCFAHPIIGAGCIGSGNA